MRYAYVQPQVEQRVATRARARVKTDPENQHRNSRWSFCRAKPAWRSAVFSTPTLITFALRMAYVRGNLNYGVSERKNSCASEVSSRAHCALRIAHCALGGRAGRREGEGAGEKSAPRDAKRRAGYL